MKACGKCTENWGNLREFEGENLRKFCGVLGENVGRWWSKRGEVWEGEGFRCLETISI